MKMSPLTGAELILCCVILSVNSRNSNDQTQRLMNFLLVRPPFLHMMMGFLHACTFAAPAGVGHHLSPGPGPAPGPGPGPASISVPHQDSLQFCSANPALPLISTFSKVKDLDASCSFPRRRGSRLLIVMTPTPQDLQYQRLAADHCCMLCPA